MSSTIKIKRSSGTTAPATLAAGELAYSFGAGGIEDNGGRLFFGTGGNEGAEKQIIGGKYFTDFLDHAPGTLTATSALLVDSNSKVNNFKVDNLDFDGNTISSTNENGAVVINPNANGKVEFDFPDNTAAFATITGATDAQYKANITGAGKENAIPNRKYVDDAVIGASSSTTLNVSNLSAPTSDPEQRVAVNLATDSLNVIGSGDISVAVAKSGTNVTFTVSSQFDLDQDVGTTDSVTFAAVTVDATTIDNNAITTTNGINLTLTATGAEVIANSLTVSDLTATRVVFVGTSGALVDDANLTFTTATGKLDVNGEFEVDNVNINGNTIGTVDTDGKLTLAPNGTGVVEIDSDALTTTEATFNLVNTTATAVNFAGAAATLSIGAATGTTTINNANTVVTGDLAVNGGDVTTSATTFNLVNATATTVNFAGAATAITIGASGSGTTTVRHDLTVTGDVAVNGGDLTTTATTFNLLNTTATALNFAGAAETLTIGATSGTTTVRNNLTVTGDLVINGTTTTVNSTTLTVDDPLIKLADGNTANSLDIGFFGQYNTTSFTGLFRDASDSNKYKLFATGTVTDNVVNTESGFTLADLAVGNLDATIDGGTY
jgi:hypothetical protein